MSLPPLATAAARGLPQPRKPPQGAPRKGAPPATAPPAAPGKPPRRGGGAPGQRPGPLAAPWKETRGRVAPPPHAARGPTATRPTARALAPSRGRRGRGAPGGSGGRPGESLSAAAPRFSLSLPPEALRGLQRRSLEEKPRPRSPDAADAGPGGDLRALLRASLLNERHRYDDVEYEEEEEEEGGEPGAPAAREGLVRKCTEWLRGVERAAARDRADPLDRLPHLSTL